jgi:competence protein ComEA
MFKFFSQPPPALVVLAVLVFSAVLLSREASITEDLPFFLPLEQTFVHIELIEEGRNSEVYQYSDGSTLLDVIKLTRPEYVENIDNNFVWSQALHSGKKLEITKKAQKITIVQRGWMSAGRRMALAIPLHPDRMDYEDWQSLPGIGVALAARIEKDRQINGDFKRLDGLLRVNGIGKKRIKSWADFFHNT